MPINDEPVLGKESGTHEEAGMDTSKLVDRIKRLVTQQPYGVLCTHGEGHAYGSLVAFAFSEDLETATFATPIATRKYRLLSEHDRVALVVDDRPEGQEDMMKVQALTVTGRAKEVKRGSLFDRLSGMLIARHPQLSYFIQADSTALFQIEVTRFLHVSRFQEVSQWVPGSPQ